MAAAETVAKGKGVVHRVAGPVVTAAGITSRMYDVVFVGKERLMGEVIEIEGDKTLIQVYEDTSGIAPGEPVHETGQPLVVELGPGLLTSIYDGIQRPLVVLKDKMGDFISRGVLAPGLDRAKKWEFQPTVKKGDTLTPGQILGTVQETPNIVHKVMLPPNVQGGRIADIKAGSFTVEETIGKLDNGTELRMMQKWPVREARPVVDKLRPELPLTTGTRILDGLFPVAKGGTAAIPGPFGSGKCVSGDTPVLLADGRLVPMENLYQTLVGLRDDGVAPEHIESLATPLHVIGFDGRKIKPVVATRLYRGTSARMLRVKTRTGRAVLVTPEHRLFRAVDARIEEVPAAALSEGDFLATPRRLPMPGRYARFPLDPSLRCADPEILGEMRKILEKEPGTLAELAGKLGGKPQDVRSWRKGSNRPRWEFIERVFAVAGRQAPHPAALKAERDSAILRVPELVDEEVGEFLGLLMSEGSVKGGKVVVFYNNDDRLLARFCALSKRLFGLKATIRQERTVKAAAINSRALVLSLSALGMPTAKKSRTVSAPPRVLSGPDGVVRAFLRAYIAGDGSVEPRGLEVVTASPAMARSLLYLFARLGIIARRKQKTVKGRVYHRVFVSPKECAALLPDSYDPGAARFDSFDVVPLSPGFLSGILKEAGYANLKSEGVEIHNYIGGGESLGRGKLATLVRVLPSRQELARFRETLSWVFCDEIVEIEEVPWQDPVYDLVVPETQNFVGGEGPVLLHNTVTQQTLAKWSDAEIVVYIGCGERGNEMTEVLKEFPELEDPKTGRPLMERTVLIANTSNMPVAAREASVYTGITIAEYYRDMGYDVSLMADSTSRWAEAMREISSRLEEMPGEEGYPAYLAAKLAAFYERAGRVKTLGGGIGSVTVIGAISPPGGDFSEPVTQNTLRIVKVFWALDAKLAQRRHFPAINWLNSYSLYQDILQDYYQKNVAKDWTQLRTWAMDTLQTEAELQDIVQLVGSDALPDEQQVTLEVARMLREIFLQQNAFHPVDTFAPLERQYKILTAIRKFNDLARKALERGVSVKTLQGIKSKAELSKARFETNFDELYPAIVKEMEQEFAGLAEG